MSRKTAPDTSTAPDEAIKPATPPDGYGLEGTNKTVPIPKDDNEPSEELGHVRHVENTPYTRG